MGNGPSYTVDPPKKLPAEMPSTQPPYDSAPSMDVAASTGGGGQNGVSFCALPQSVPFAATAPDIEAGTEVRLVIGIPPSVHSLDGDKLGVISGQGATAMQNCIELEYEMRGTVESFDASGRDGLLRLAGSPP